MKKLLLISLLATGSLWAQVNENGAVANKTSFSLQEAQDYAMVHSYNVVNKELDFKQARQTIRQTAAQGLPQISASGDYQYNPQVFQQPIPAQFIDPEAPAGEFVTVAFGVAHQSSLGLNYNQLLLDGSYFVALQATKVVKEAAHLDWESQQLEASKNVAQSYYGVLVSEETARLLKENLESLTKSYNETKKLNENGFVESQDVDQLELLVNNLQNNLNNAKRQIELARQLLKFNMGIPLSRDIELTSNLEEVMALDNAGTLLTDTFNYEEHVDYRAAMAQLKGARLEVKHQKATNYPTLSGFVRHSEANYGETFSKAFDNEWVPTTSLGLSLSWNIFTGLRRSASVEKARIDMQRAEMARDIAKNQLALNYNRARSNYEFALDNYNNQKHNVEVSKSIRDKTRIKFNEGLNSSLDLTQAENQYLQTQQDYLQALLNVLNAKETLDQALGQF